LYDADSTSVILRTTEYLTSCIWYDKYDLLFYNIDLESSAHIAFSCSCPARFQCRIRNVAVLI